MHIANLSYRATLELRPGEPRTLEATAMLEEGSDLDKELRELHEWVEDQLFLLCDLAADRRPGLRGVHP